MLSHYEKKRQIQVKVKATKIFQGKALQIYPIITDHVLFWRVDIHRPMLFDTSSFLSLKKKKRFVLLYCLAFGSCYYSPIPSQSVI